jgi:hypothetical protein
MRNFFTLGLFLLVTTSCGTDKLEYYEGRHGMWTPKPMYFGYLPQGSDSYSQGVRDGCNSALSTITQGLQRSNYEDIYMDVNRNIAEDEYNKGWTNGHNYCTQYNDTDPI